MVTEKLPADHPNSLKDMSLITLIIPTDISVLTIIKGTENNIALVRLRGSFNGIHLSFNNSVCRL